MAIESFFPDFMNNFKFEPGTYPLTTFMDAYVYGPFGYLALLFVLYTFMKNRSAYDLRYAVAIHNAILSVMSLIMFVGIILAIFFESRQTMYGFWDSICDPHQRVQRSSVAFWEYIFYLSKFYEFFDTVFLVLRKKPLTFLHVYHHFIVLPLFWNFQASHSMAHYFLIITNTFVHIFMYYYFVLSTLGIQVWWKKYITALQIAQFFFDMMSTAPFLISEPLDIFGCTCSVWAIWFGQFVGFTFLILFGKLYNDLYKNKKVLKEGKVE